MCVSKGDTVLVNLGHALMVNSTDLFRRQATLDLSVITFNGGRSLPGIYDVTTINVIVYLQLCAMMRIIHSLVLCSPRLGV